MQRKLNIPATLLILGTFFLLGLNALSGASQNTSAERQKIKGTETCQMQSVDKTCSESSKGTPTPAHCQQHCNHVQSGIPSSQSNPAPNVNFTPIVDLAKPVPPSVSLAPGSRPPNP